MAQNDSAPITVKLTSAKTALSEINKAINKALLTEDSNLNKQFQDELKMQASLSNLEDTLNLKGMALNGPIVGLTIPTLQQLYAPLRKILQNTYYPCDANPFIGDVAPSIIDNPAIITTNFTVAGGDQDTDTLNFTAAIPQQVVIDQQIYGPGIPVGTSIIAVGSDTIQLSNKLTSDASTANNAYSVTTAADLQFTAKSGGTNMNVVIVNSAQPLTAGLSVSGDGIDQGTVISKVPDANNVMVLSKPLIGPLTGDANAYTATFTIAFAAEKPTANTGPGTKGQPVIKFVDHGTDPNKVSQLLQAGQSITGQGIPAGTKIKSVNVDGLTITLTANLTTNASSAANNYKASADIAFTVQATKGAIIEVTSTKNLAVGQWVVGAGVTTGSVIASIDPIHNTITLNTVMNSAASTTANDYTAVPVAVVNFWIQALIFQTLDSDFRNLLSNYKDTSDASLEEEMVYYLQKQISSIVERDLTPDRILNLASGLSSGPDATDNQLSIVNFEVDNTNNPGFNIKIDEIESSYYDSLNGFESGVFPPPGGRDFLTNLENQIILSIKQNVTSTLKTKGKNAPSKAQIAALNAVTHEINVVRTGVHDALFNKIAELGIQGTLLADTYDNEISKGVKQNMSSLLDGSDQFKASLTDINATAKIEAQSILDVRDDVETFRENFSRAFEALQANANSFNSGTVSYNALYSTLNGKGSGNLAYLDVLIGGTGGSTMPVLDDVESRSVQTTAEIAGLLYMANSVLVRQTPSNQATTLDNSITAQVSDDVSSLSAALTAYATALANYLAAYQTYKSAEQSVEAGSTVEGTVTNMLSASPSTHPNFN